MDRGVVIRGLSMIIGKKYNVIHENDSSNLHCKTYVCEDLITNDPVFIKRLKAQTIGNDVAKELFYREYKSLSILNHDSIIKYIDSGFIDEDPFIVTEYFKDQTLYSYLKSHTLDLEEKLDISLKIVSGFIHAHEKKVIHRDIKPQNILIDDNLRIKIIDFGISKIIGMLYDSSTTMKNYMSVRYAAPEQFQRLEARIESDLYSLGLLLGFIFTGNEPPDNRAEINNYLETIDITEIKSLIRELINEDLNKRPRSAYKVENVLKQLQINCISETRKVFFKPLSGARNKLYNLGMVDNENNFSEIKYFINADTRNYSAFKYRNAYYFIGDKIKYVCKLSDDQKSFLITDVNALDDQVIWEIENSKGVPLFIPWTVLDKLQNPSEKNDIMEVIQLLADVEREKQNKKAKRSINNKLLSNWEALLIDEFRLLDEKKNIGTYTDILLDEIGYKVRITIRNCNVVLDKNDRIQLTLLGGNQQKTVGNFDTIIDETTISITLDSNVDIDEYCKMGVLSLDTKEEKVNLRRYMRALNSVKNDDTYNPNISRILNDPSIVTINKVIPISKEQFAQSLFTNEDAPNAIAVKRALATKDIFLLQGPPGTGKTTVIVEIMCQILRREENAKILLASQSNAAVDHAVKKAAKEIPNKRIIRIGRSDKIAKSSEHLLYSNQIEDWVRDVKANSLNALFKYLSKDDGTIKKEDVDAYINTSSLQNDQSQEIQLQFPNLKIDSAKKVFELVNQWHKSLGKLDDFDEIFADKASIIAATCMGIASKNKLGEMQYDWVIIDEAAKATPLETLVPLVRGKKIIMVGDHRQLPPTIKTNIDKYKLRAMGLKKADLEKSLFEELIGSISRDAKVVLTEQFRMHPAISNMISEVFYPSEKITSSISANDRQHRLRKWKDKPIIWINTDKIKSNKETNVAFSKKNQAEARVIRATLEEINREYESMASLEAKVSVGIISGYDAQRKVLVDLINPDDTTKWSALNISIDNVDAFQGSEVDIAIYSIVRCNEKYEIGFLSDERRLNVALSRGKTCVIIVGSLEFIKSAKGLFGNNPFAMIVKHIERNREYCQVEVYNE